VPVIAAQALTNVSQISALPLCAAKHPAPRLARLNCRLGSGGVQALASSIATARVASYAGRRPSIHFITESLAATVEVLERLRADS